MMAPRSEEIADNTSPRPSRDDTVCTTSAPEMMETDHSSSSPNTDEDLKLTKFIMYHRRKNNSIIGKRQDEATIASATSRTTKSSTSSYVSDNQSGGGGRRLHHRRRSSIRIVKHPEVPHSSVLHSSMPSLLDYSGEMNYSGDKAIAPPRRLNSLETLESEGNDQTKKEKKSDREGQPVSRKPRRGSKIKSNSKGDCDKEINGITPPPERRSISKKRQSKSGTRRSTSRSRRSMRIKHVRSPSNEKSKHDPTSSLQQGNAGKSPQPRRGSRRLSKQSIVVDPAELEELSKRSQESMEPQSPRGRKERRSSRRLSKQSIVVDPAKLEEPLEPSPESMEPQSSRGRKERRSSRRLSKQSIVVDPAKLEEPLDRSPESMEPQSSRGRKERRSSRRLSKQSIVVDPALLETSERSPESMEPKSSRGRKERRSSRRLSKQSIVVDPALLETSERSPESMEPQSPRGRKPRRKSKISRRKETRDNSIDPLDLYSSSVVDPVNKEDRSERSISLHPLSPSGRKERITYEPRSRSRTSRRRARDNSIDPSDLHSGNMVDPVKKEEPLERSPSQESIEPQSPRGRKDRKSDEPHSKSGTSRRKESRDNSIDPSDLHSGSKQNTKSAKRRTSTSKKLGKPSRQKKTDEDEKTKSPEKGTKNSRKIRLRRDDDATGLNGSRHTPDATGLNGSRHTPSVASSKQQIHRGRRRRSRSTDRNTVPERLKQNIDRVSMHDNKAELAALAIIMGDDDDDVSESFHRSVEAIPTHLLDPANIPLTLHW